MDLLKTLQSGVKAGLITLLSIFAVVLVGTLTYALGYRPEGNMETVVFTYVITPLLAGIIGALNNWLKHKDDPKKAVEVKK